MGEPYDDRGWQYVGVQVACGVIISIAILAAVAASVGPKAAADTSRFSWPAAQAGNTLSVIRDNHDEKCWGVVQSSDGVSVFGPISCN